MNWKKEWKPLSVIISVFLAFYFIPVDSARFINAVTESLLLTKWYAQEHVILCLVPAFFIAGAIAVFISQASVMKYLGAKANKVISYGVASVSGTILAVCSCTVLPLFAGIYRMGAGLGPATAFLYSGPAINVLAIILTARVLGLELGVARAVGAVLFSIVIGLLMHFIFRREESEKINAQVALPEQDVERPLWKNAIYFALMVAILVFANWGKPVETSGIWHIIYSAKWILTSIAAVALGAVLLLWFGMKWINLLMIAVPSLLLAFLFPDNPIISFAAGFTGLSVVTSRSKGEMGEWFDQTWGFTKQIMLVVIFRSPYSRCFVGESRA